MADGSIMNVRDSEPVEGEDEVAKITDISQRVDELFMKIEKLEQQVHEVEQFYISSCRKHKNLSSWIANKDKLKHAPGLKKQQMEASRREAAAYKRMQELMRQFGSILRQITQHKWAWPFMQPVDVEGLGLQDYYEVIDRPMDFSTIKNQMESKDGTGYEHVRDIYADVMLVFSNAMKYNDDTTDVYDMAKTLLEKFEEKWLQFLPRVNEEEKRCEEEKMETQLDMQQAEAAAHAKLVSVLSSELCKAGMQLEELGEMVVRKCRKMSIEDKRNLGIALVQLSPEDLSKALDIVAENNPNFQAYSEEVELDINAQSECTLWRLKFFVKDALGARRPAIGPVHAVSPSHKLKPTKCTTKSISADVGKRKAEVQNDIAKARKRRNKNSA